MKIQSLGFLFCLVLFMSITYAQTSVDNLRSYKTLNYYIDQQDEETCILCIVDQFTQANVRSKIRNFFNENNLPATEITRVAFPYLRINIKKPVRGSIQGYNSYGNSYFYVAHDYEVEFNVGDIIGGKTVTVYHITHSKLKVDESGGDAPGALWASLNACLDDFLTDWQATHVMSALHKNNPVQGDAKSNAEQRAATDKLMASIRRNDSIANAEKNARTYTIDKTKNAGFWIVKFEKTTILQVQPRGELFVVGPDIVDPKTGATVTVMPSIILKPGEWVERHNTDGSNTVLKDLDRR